MPLVEIKDFNELIDNKPFFDQPVKNKQEAYKKLVKMSRNDYYTTGLLYKYKLIGIDLSRQTKPSIPQINLTEKLQEDDRATMFFMAERQQKTIVNISLDSLIVTK